jgi:hypothetical protein
MSSEWPPESLALNPGMPGMSTEQANWNQNRFGDRYVLSRAVFPQNEQFPSNQQTIIKTFKRWCLGVSFIVLCQRGQLK